MYLCAVQFPQVKIAAIPSPEYKTFLIVISHFVKQAESFYKIGSLVPLSAATFQYGVPVYLAVVAPDLFLVKIIL